MNAAEIAANLGQQNPDGAGNWKCLCPVCGRNTLSLKDNDGRVKLLIKCFGGCESKDIRRELKERKLSASGPGNGTLPQDDLKHDELKRIADAVDFWRNDTLPIAGRNPALTYLASRLLLQQPMDVLRYAPSFYHPLEMQTYPALVGLLEHEKLGPVAIHAVCLNPLDPTSKLTIKNRKISRGVVKGAAVRLFPVEGPELAIGGLEDCLAFQQSTGIPAWAVPGDEFMVNFEPPPLDIVSTIILLEDQDEPGRKAVAKAKARFTGMGYRVRIARPFQGKDIAQALSLIGLADPICAIDDGGVSLTDFFSVMTDTQYVYIPNRTFWPAQKINGRFSDVQTRLPDGSTVKLKPAKWLDMYRPAEQMSWAPGEPLIINDWLINEGGWIHRPGARCLNLYLPPTLPLGDPTLASLWVDHVHTIYPNDADHIIAWCAHRVQRPQEKINHALILAGHPGIGKDTLLEPVRRAVGPWNFREASPTQVMARFNGFLKGVILRISEVKDLGDADRFKLYEHMKGYTAAPPDVLRCDEKNIREHSILNVCGVVYTTNYKAEGLYLSADDRRHYVAWSTFKKNDFPAQYWIDLWSFIEGGGDCHVAAYLAQYPLSTFNPKAPPPLTEPFWEIVNAHRPPEDAEMMDTLEAYAQFELSHGVPATDLLNRNQLLLPKAVTLRRIVDHASPDFRNWLEDRKNRRVIPHRFEACHYVPVRNPDAKDESWKIGGRRETVYVPEEFNLHDRLVAAKNIAR
jgi:hypothetical protein